MTKMEIIGGYILKFITTCLSIFTVSIFIAYFWSKEVRNTSVEVGYMIHGKKLYMITEVKDD
jgi:hypothetical protein